LPTHTLHTHPTYYHTLPAHTPQDTTPHTPAYTHWGHCHTYLCTGFHHHLPPHTPLSLPHTHTVGQDPRDCLGQKDFGCPRNTQFHTFRKDIYPLCRLPYRLSQFQEQDLLDLAAPDIPPPRPHHLPFRDLLPFGFERELKLRRQPIAAAPPVAVSGWTTERAWPFGWRAPPHLACLSPPITFHSAFSYVWKDCQDETSGTTHGTDFPVLHHSPPARDGGTCEPLPPTLPHLGHLPRTHPWFPQDLLPCAIVSVPHTFKHLLPMPWFAIIQTAFPPPPPHPGHPTHRTHKLVPTLSPLPGHCATLPTSHT